MLDAAVRLRHRPEIVFLIIGEGNQKESLQQEAGFGKHGRGLANVLFKPYQPKEQLPLKGYRSATIKFSLRNPTAGCAPGVAEAA